MVGGYDFEASEFNRAFQACRQPGSAFKPVVYAAAVEKLDFTPATILTDAPIVFRDDESSWKPQNYGEDFKGDVTRPDRARELDEHPGGEDGRGARQPRRADGAGRLREAARASPRR